MARTRQQLVDEVEQAYDERQRILELIEDGDANWLDLEDLDALDEALFELEAELSFHDRRTSGWTYRESQENGDRVDCWSCGNPLDDDFPILNDDRGFAYHEDCVDPDPPA